MRQLYHKKEGCVNPLFPNPTEQHFYHVKTFPTLFYRDTFATKGRLSSQRQEKLRWLLLWELQPNSV